MIKRVVNPRYLLLFYLTTIIQVCVAQFLPELPVVVEASPQSKAFTRYGEYPMNGNTGLVDISIPLYQIKTKKLNLPISMSFHASGRKANETNGILGMRWTLNCGGLVTRTMKGRPDEWDRLTNFSANPDEAPSFETLYNSCTEGYRYQDYSHATKYDSEFDIFNYSLPNGKSGKFILKKENGVLVPFLIPFEPLRIRLIQDLSYQGYFKKIEITDTDGIKYIFGGESATSDYVEFNTDNPHEDMVGGIPTGWYLNKIISEDEKDDISFTYLTRSFSEYTFNESVRVSDRMRDNSLSGGPDALDPYWTYLVDYLYEIPREEAGGFTKRSFRTPVIASVRSKSETILFAYSERSVYENKWLLDDISISGAPNRKISFTSSLHPFEKDIFYLNKVSFRELNQTGASGEVYNFSYYEPAMSGEIEPTSTSARNKDWWGYNVRYTQHTLPYQSVGILRPSFGSNFSISRDIGYYGVSRDEDEYARMLGMLKTVKYPTGGETEFLYENNKFDYFPNYNPPSNTATLMGPGLRVKEIISKPVTGKNLHKIFRYGEYEDGRGYVNQHLKPGKNVGLEGTVMHYWDWSSYDGLGHHMEHAGHRTRDYLSDSYLSFDLAGSPVVYDAITEYQQNESGDITNKMITTYSIGYDEVQDFNVHDYGEGFSFDRKFAIPGAPWEKSLLLSKSYYKKNNGIYSLIKQDIHDYELFDIDFAWDMPTYRHGNVVIAYDKGPYANPSFNYHSRLQVQYAKEKEYHENVCSIYGYGFRKYTSGAAKIREIKSKEYFEDIVEKKTTFSYDTSYLLTKTEESIDSRGGTYKKHYNYPFDLITSVTAAMVSRHILDKKVQTDTYTGALKTESHRVNYHDWGSGILAPISEDLKVGGNDYERRLEYGGYDNQGNLLSVSKTRGPKICYVYSYSGQYPVAKIENAEYSNVVSALSGASQVEWFRNLVSPSAQQVKDFLAPLHTALPNAMITVYTYKSSVGMTSETDVKGRTTYYDYDGFGRLQRIRNHEDQVIKQFCYNYAGQVINCVPLQP
ncbi:hypothetical protein [Arcticibacter pallidicorallinus]|uniref:hypothetical protein n=1 Tax=Arcticibacter pallidicorallinus TaxID=1259464 RepID=UPI0011B21A97|nr:hypothetical protein [Arcticibacter pallidicorallinus]